MPEEADDRSSGAGQARTAALIVLLLLVPLAYSLVSRAIPMDTAAGRRFLEMPDPKHKACVKATEYMRYHHWEMLRGVREQVVRYGIRGEIVLSRCPECHTSKERFCNRCHDAVSLTPDCFDCHHYP
jgi:hypothetical protein